MYEFSTIYTVTEIICMQSLCKSASVAGMLVGLISKPEIKQSTVIKFTDKCKLSIIRYCGYSDSYLRVQLVPARARSTESGVDNGHGCSIYLRTLWLQQYSRQSRGDADGNDNSNHAFIRSAT